MKLKGGIRVALFVFQKKNGAGLCNPTPLISQPQYIGDEARL
jgi:hypothetical protein